MFAGKRKFEVSDPVFYDALIAKQRKRVRKHPRESKEWLELGRLCEAKIDMIQYAARRQFVIRYFLPIFALSFLGITISFHFFVLKLPLSPWQLILNSVIYIFVLIAFVCLWYLRYPPSGSKYFRKAINIDPTCGDAYMYLGLIALRRFKKRKAYRFLEQALRLNGGSNIEIKQKLKSIYEQEFVSFFREKSEKERRQQEIIDHQLDQIRQLRSKNANLEERVERLSAKMDQARWKNRHKKKLLNKPSCCIKIVVF